MFSGKIEIFGTIIEIFIATFYNSILKFPLNITSNNVSLTSKKKQKTICCEKLSTPLKKIIQIDDSPIYS